MGLIFTIEFQTVSCTYEDIHVSAMVHEANYLNTWLRIMALISSFCTKPTWKLFVALPSCWFLLTPWSLLLYCVRIWWQDNAQTYIVVDADVSLLPTLGWKHSFSIVDKRVIPNMLGCATRGHFLTFICCHY